MAFSYYLLIFLSFYIYIAKSTDPMAHSCNEQNTNNSQLSANIDTLLSTLVKTITPKGFTTTSYGKSKAKVYGLAQCRGDVSTKDCSNCIQDGAKEIRKLCPNQAADAKIWYDYCFIRYNTQNFFGQVDTSGIYFYNVENVTDPENFNKKLGALMGRVKSQAMMSTSNGLGKGESKLSPFVTVYGLSQCTRDLSQLSCAQCLAIAIGNFPTFCDDKKGCRVLYGSCYVRYELYPFYFPLDSKAVLASTSMSNYLSVVSKP